MSALRIGLTGGVASGKSTVARLFAELGVPVIDADQAARAVVAPGTPLLEQVLQRFGAHLRRADGSLDRAALRRAVFADARERRALEALLHPAVRAHIAELAARAGGPYQIHVIPLLVEAHARGLVERVLVVDCPEALQLQRLQARDGCDAVQARAMLDSQATRAERLALADDVIVNDADRAALVQKVGALHHKYLTLAAAVGRSTR